MQPGGDAWELGSGRSFSKEPLEELIEIELQVMGTYTCVWEVLRTPSMKVEDLLP